MDIAFLQKLRLLGIIEGISTLILFGVAMPLKYIWGMPQAVSVVGMIHGILFICLVVAYIMGAKRIPIGYGLMFAGIFGAVVPFGPFVVDIWLKRLHRAQGSFSDAT